jgi:hypothetical protein
MTGMATFFENPCEIQCHMRIKIMKSKGILVALAILACLFGCQPEEPATVPDELLGVWETSAPKYKDSFFELTKDTLTFANRDLDYIDVNSISKIEKIHREKGILYTIHYENREGQEYKFAFYYDPLRGGAIRFKNQDQIEWRKANVPSNENPS